MGKPQAASSSATPSSKRGRLDDSPGAVSPPGNSFADILESIDKRLISLDGRLALVEVLHKEFQALRESLEFSQQQVLELTAENKALKTTVDKLKQNEQRIIADYNKIKEGMLDIQARSMRDNLVVSGIAEQAGEDPEKLLKKFIKENLKIPEETVNKITFHRVHRLGGIKPNNQRPRPIIAKFEHYKQKEFVKSRGRELKGSNLSMNDQFPAEILQRRRVLFPIRKRLLEAGSRAVITVDKLYVDGRLYREEGVTTWLT